MLAIPKAMVAERLKNPPSDIVSRSSAKKKTIRRPEIKR